jgi:hypothetical protein
MYAVSLVACLLLLPASSVAQTAGTIVGDVVDPSGASIPGVTIRVTSEATGLEREVESNEVGQYRVSPLNPGTYMIQVENAGFKTQLRSGVVLQVADVLEVDFTLELGEVTETIEVTGAAPIMQTQEASVAGVVNEAELKRLPVNQRNFTKLILLMPGTSSRRRSQARGVDESGTQLYSVNGSRPQDNNYTIDGIDSNMMMMNSPGMSPPMDAIQEFKVATNTSAEFARSAGANVNMVIKSGTSAVHGSVYEYFRNDKLDANEFFANRSGRGKVPFRLNQFGVAIGGPVAMPGTDWGNKMFWFFNYEGLRRRRGNTQLGSVPPAAFRAGDFSDLLSDADPTIITDPFDNGNPFPNNVMPAARINPAVPTGLDIVEPLPNLPGRALNFANNQSQAADRNQLHARWDYHPGDNDTFNFRFSRQDSDLLNPNVNPNFLRTAEFDIVNYGGTWNHIFSPTTILETRFGTNQPNLPNITATDVITRGEFFDRTGITMFQREVFGDSGLALDFGEYRVTRGSGTSTGDNIWQGASSLSHSRGKHNFKFSGQYQYRNFFTDTSNPMNGNASFNGQITGFPMADALLGFPTEVRRGQGNTLTDGISHFMIASVQDDWRVNSKLTVNLGMMYQFGSRPYDSTDRLGNLWVRRDEQSGEMFGTLMWAAENPQPAPPDGRVPSPLDSFTTGRPANTAGWGRALVGSDYNDFAPRVGIAYRVNEKTVIRTGFGIFYNSTFVQELQDLRKFWPYTVQQVFSPNRGGLPDFSITGDGPPFSSTAAIGGWPQQPDNRSPYSMQWNFFIQRQLMDDMTFDIGYVGSASKKQIGYSPFNNAITPGPGDVQPRRLLPSFGDLDGGSNQYNGRYDSLQLKLVKRFSSGLQFNMNYTWQKALDGQSSLAEVKVQDPFNRRLDYSRSSWDTRQAFNFAYVYDLPFGKGRKLGSGWSGAANLIAGGWSLEGITRLETAPPINVQTRKDISNTGRHRQRPNLLGNPNNGPKTVDEWFNTSAFEEAAPFTFGNAGAYITDADGIISFDIAVQKTFAIAEGHAIELRTEFFNLPNNVNFDRPQERSDRAFGQISGQSVDSRQIQFALRYRF